MADPQDIPEDVVIDSEEVATNRAIEQGLGVGARELAAIHESGAEGTLERADDPAPDEEDAEGLEVGDMGRSASVLDHDEAE